MNKEEVQVNEGTGLLSPSSPSLTALQCSINRRVPWGPKRTFAACGGAGSCFLPQETGLAMLPVSQQQGVPVHIKLCASCHISHGPEPACDGCWDPASVTKVRAHLKEYAPQMKTAPASPASSPSPVFCPPSPASCIPQIYCREGRRHQDKGCEQ